MKADAWGEAFLLSAYLAIAACAFAARWGW